jgi:hypothetical protein
LAELKKLVQDGKSTTVQPLLISGVLAIALMIALGFFVTSLTAIFCPKYLSCSEYVVREFEIAKVVYFVGLTLGVATVALRIYRAWSAFDPSEPWVERMTAFRSRAEPLLLELRR